MGRAAVCCRYDLKKLLLSPILWAVAVVICLYLENLERPIKLLLAENNLRASLSGLTVYLLNDSAVTLITGFLFLLLLADAPFADGARTMILLRAGRKSYGRGQALYIFCVALFFPLILSLAASLLSLPQLTLEPVWSGGMEAFVLDGGYEIYDSMLDFDPYLMESYTALGALFTILPLRALSLFSLGLIVYLINLGSSTRLGVALSAVFLLFDTAIVEFFPEDWYWFSPVSLSRLSALDYGDGMGRPPVWYAFLLLSALGAILVWASVKLSRSKDWKMGGCV